MKDLIERLKKAAGPNRELDISIHLAAGRYVKTEYTALRDVPQYTKSIDAALTLVPVGNWWEVSKRCDERSPLRHYYAGRTGLYDAKTHHDYGASGYSGNHDYPAIALCIAACEARQPRTTLCEEENNCEQEEGA